MILNMKFGAIGAIRIHSTKMNLSTSLGGSFNIALKFLKTLLSFEPPKSSFSSCKVCLEPGGYFLGP